VLIISLKNEVEGETVTSKMNVEMRLEDQEIDGELEEVWTTEEFSGDAELIFYETGSILLGYDFPGYINSFEIINHNGDLVFDRTAAISKNYSNLQF
jgi:hypothetical protein